MVFGERLSAMLLGCVEFKNRDELRHNLVKDMLGYGSHNQPAGTWSDDSSLMLCTVESLLKGFDMQDLGRYFLRWYKEGYWTPWGKVFDIGITTAQAINRLSQGAKAEDAGLTEEQSNGNGSLMRILPIALRFNGRSPDEIVEYAHKASSLTHKHPRSLMACGFYCLLADTLLRESDLDKAYLDAVQKAKTHYAKPPYSGELRHFDRLFSGLITGESADTIRSHGYVIDTLEASVWCLLKTGSFQEAVLKAVNLGHDTDTTGTVTGGLAGIHYGLKAVPDHWLNQIVRRTDIRLLFESFTSSVMSCAR